MSYPPPPGLKSASISSPTSTTPQSHSSLPPRPPPSSFKPAFSSAPVPVHTAPGVGSYGGSKSPAPSAGYNAFTAFAPRSVASPGFRNNAATPPAYAAAPTNYNSGPQSSNYGPAGYGDQSYSAAASTPTIQNPFAPPSQQSANGGYGAQQADYDPELEAQIAQWQSAYASKDDSSKPGVRKDGAAAATGANNGPLGPSRFDESTKSSTPESAAAKTVVRSGGGQTWQDPSLLEWDPAHFRLFVGNLAGEVTDDSLLKAFSKYLSVQKARVVRDKRTTKSKGYGFVSFSDGDEYFQAARDMQGKYIGSHPVLLRRSTTEIRPTAQQNNRGGKHGKGGKGGGHGGAGGGKVSHGGIEKKQPKTKGGLKLLG